MSHAMKHKTAEKHSPLHKGKQREGHGKWQQSPSRKGVAKV